MPNFRNKPLVSVIMSVYNEEQYVGRAIESILAQTYRNFELIIINDYSTDGSLKICETFSDQRIRIHSKTKEPKYLASSRNIGVQMAKGAYIILQDADDLCSPERIEKQLTKALEHPGWRVVGCCVKRIEGVKEYVLKLPEAHASIVQGFTKFYNRATICSGTILAPKIIFQKFPYRLRFKYMQDWDHSLRMFESGKVEFYNIQEPLYIYFIRKKGTLFNPEWINYNIFVRNCQERRKYRLKEFKTIADFHTHLRCHPIKRMKWFFIKRLLLMKNKLFQIKYKIKEKKHVQY